MGKKSNQSSDVEVKVATEENETGIIDKGCTHASKSFQFNQVRKCLRGKDSAHNVCHICKQPWQKADFLICLFCGTKTCCKEHAEKHTKAPHSDPHLLVLNLKEITVWCFECEKDFSVKDHRQLKGHINFLEKMHESYASAKETSLAQNEKPNKMEEEEVKGKTELRVPPTQSTTKETKSAQPCVGGLINLGNTCFFNSVLQCLAQTSLFIEELRSMESPRDLRINLPDDCIIEGSLSGWDELCNSLTETLVHIRSSGQAYKPIKLLSNLRKEHQQFEGSDQHDSHELLRHLLDSVRNCDRRRHRKILRRFLGVVGNENIVKAKQDESIKAKLKDLEGKVIDAVGYVPDKTFKGTLVSRLQCGECQNVSECMENFLDLSLPVSAEKPQPPAIRKKGGQQGVDAEDKDLMLNEERKTSKKKLGKREGRTRSRHDACGDVELGVDVILADDVFDADGDIEEGQNEERKHESGYCSDKQSSARNSASSDEGHCPSPDSARASPVPSEPLSSPESSPLVTWKHHPISEWAPVSIPLLDDGYPDLSKLNLDHPRGVKSDPFCPDLNVESISAETKDWESIVESHRKTRVTNDLTKEVEVTAGAENCSQTDLFPAPPPPPKNEKCSSPISPVRGGQKNKSCFSKVELLDTVKEEENSYLLNDTRAQLKEGECSVESCLRQFTSIELMAGSNKVGCSACTARQNQGNPDGKTVYTNSTKQLLIVSTPPVLILHLKRFQVQRLSFKKLPNHVSFPLVLDLSPFCTKPSDISKPVERMPYSLYGIVEHSGTLNSGHYVAYVKVENENKEYKWFHISDSRVREISESSVLNCQAYLLFYRRLPA